MSLENINRTHQSCDEVIVTENLWKTYIMGDQELHALRGVNLRICHNEYVAIMGPSATRRSASSSRPSTCCRALPLCITSSCR